MFRKTAILWVILMSALVISVYAQGTADFTGTVEGTPTTRVADGKFEIALKLAEYPKNTYLISLRDAPKFGLSKDVEIPSGPDFDQFVSTLEALKGRKVKLSCIKEASGAQEYRVKGFEKLSGK